MRALLVFMLTLYSAVDDSPANNVVKSVCAYREANEVQILEALRDYVAIPNVTADGANVPKKCPVSGLRAEETRAKRRVAQKQDVNPVV